MIVAEGVTKRYGEAVVVDGVSVTIPSGGVTAIIGPNGAGKSTFLALIGRLTKMDSGAAQVGGLDVARTPTDVLARRLAILRQENHLTARLTVRDLVGFGRYPHGKGRPAPGDKDHVDRALAWLDLKDLEGRFLDELSGGQRQRAFIAMAICQDAEYMLLDEPLNSLDMKHAAAIMGLLRRAAKELGKTVVTVLHDVNFASWHADHIVAMRAGKVARQGPPEAIVTPEALRAIYDMEIPVREIDGRRIALFYG